METGDNDINSNFSAHGEDFSPENMDGEFLRSQYCKELQEKARYRKLWLELQERCAHYH